MNKKVDDEGVGTATEVIDAVTLLTTAEAATHYAAGEDLLQAYK